MVLDLILMVRILVLKLRRTYLFITLFAFLSLFYDAIELAMGSDSPDFHGVWIFSKFVYGIVFPLAAWDLFEEAKPFIDKVRKLAMSRMITGLVFILFWGLLVAAFTGGNESGNSLYLVRVALFVWTGSVASVLAFLWVMKKGIKANNWELPWNTAIWYRYFQLLLVIEAFSCVRLMAFQILQDVAPKTIKTVDVVSDTAMQAFWLGLTGWCIYKLRAIPTTASNVQVDVNG